MSKPEPYNSPRMVKKYGISRSMNRVQNFQNLAHQSMALVLKKIADNDEAYEHLLCM